LSLLPTGHVSLGKNHMPNCFFDRLNSAIGIFHYFRTT
jgi:hypothetical protein